MAEEYMTKEEKLRKKQREDKYKEMIRINQEAKDAGMSYGKYVALKKMKGEEP